VWRVKFAFKLLKNTKVLALLDWVDDKNDDGVARILKITCW